MRNWFCNDRGRGERRGNGERAETPLTTSFPALFQGTVLFPGEEVDVKYLLYESCAEDLQSSRALSPGHHLTFQLSSFLYADFNSDCCFGTLYPPPSPPPTTAALVEIDGPGWRGGPVRKTKSLRNRGNDLDQGGDGGRVCDGASRRLLNVDCGLSPVSKVTLAPSSRSL